MSRKQQKPLVDLSGGGTLDDLVDEARGRSLRIELETGLRMERTGKNNALKTTCTARLYTKRSTPGGAQTFVPLCMPMVGETWAEVLEPLALLLDDKKWSDVPEATSA